MAVLSRKTLETDINATLTLEKCENSISTGIGFFDHMLNSFAVHSEFGLKLTCKGDLHVDAHHTVEDCGIVLGKLLGEAIDKTRIARYGSAMIPMDEALGVCVLDVSGRPFLVFDADFDDDKVGEFDTSLTVEFFRAVAFNSGITLHLSCPYGDNSHHKIEAMFKAFAHALKAAVQPKEQILSAKGTL
jgi:imidazoleglycerol-phosphate dehydratase